MPHLFYLQLNFFIINNIFIISVYFVFALKKKLMIQSVVEEYGAPLQVNTMFFIRTYNKVLVISVLKLDFNGMTICHLPTKEYVAEAQS